MLGDTHSQHTNLIPKVYYGNITTSGIAEPSLYQFVEVTDSKVIFTGYDLSAAVQCAQKLDLLFYNRVNELGEVLSSLVYISDALALNDVTEKEYDVRKLYRNTDLERRFNLTGVTDFTFLNYKWATPKFYTSSISPLAKYSYEELSIAGNPSVLMSKYGVCFDGWYTQMSVGLQNSTAIVTPLKNTLAMYSSVTYGNWPAVRNTAEAGSQEAYWDLCYEFHTGDTTFNPDGSVNVPGTQMAAVLGVISASNPYIKQELFVTSTLVDLYKTHVVKYAEEANYGSPYPILRNKHRVINIYADKCQFEDAQFLLQSMEYFCTTVR